MVANQNPHGFVWFATEPQYAFAPREISNKQATLYEKLLTGQKILKSNVIAHYNYLYVGDRALIFNTLSVRYYGANEKEPKRHQLYLVLDDGSSLSFCGSLGGPLFLYEVDKKALDAHDELSSVLSDNFTQTSFLDLIKNTDLTKLQPSKSVKCFLATKNRIPGLDNIILHEILWEAQVNPKSMMAAIGADAYKRLYMAIKKVFPVAIAAGGLDTKKDLYGNYGGYITKASKHTLGKPCKRCGDLIIKEAYMGGSVYYCPQCQPIIKI